jgi:hypothetical protein
LIIARTLLGVTFNRFAASVVLMSLMVQKVYHSGENMRARNNFLDKRNSALYSGPHPPKRAG